MSKILLPRLKITLLVIVILLYLVSVIGLTDDAAATRILQLQGYTSITLTGRNLLSCGEYDVFRTGFTAISPSNTKVTGTVCSGIFKGSTTRLD